MAFDIRKVPDAIAFALVAANNKRQLDAISTSFHLDRTSTTNRSEYQTPTVTPVSVTAATATNEATAVALVNDIKRVLDKHFADTIAHDTATSAAVTIADATNTATGVTLANNLKSVYGTHLSAANVHYTNDSTNTVTNADATDLTTLNTLINEIKGDVNTHMASAPAGSIINLIPA
jgi:hypothetical protein